MELYRVSRLDLNFNILECTVRAPLQILTEDYIYELFVIAFSWPKYPVYNEIVI